MMLLFCQSYNVNANPFVIELNEGTDTATTTTENESERCFPFTSPKRSCGHPRNFQMGYNDEGVLNVSLSAAVGMPWGRYMEESLKSTLKSTGGIMLQMVERGGFYLDPSYPLFSSMPRDYGKDAIRELSVYGVFETINQSLVLIKVGSATDLLMRSADYDNVIIRCLIHVDAVSVDVYKGICAELDKMIDWIIDPQRTRWKSLSSGYLLSLVRLNMATGGH